MTGKTKWSPRPQIVAGVLALLWSGLASAADWASAKPVHLVVGYTAQIFTDVDAEEARGITRVWAEQILQLRDRVAIQPVFFQKADACLTTRQAFDVVKELNPQVDNDLMVVAQSQDIAGGVLVFRSDYDPQARETMTEVLATLHADPQGNQLLRLFRMSRLIPWKPAYVASVESLLEEHDSLRKSLERRE